MYIRLRFCQSCIPVWGYDFWSSTWVKVISNGHWTKNSLYTIYFVLLCDPTFFIVGLLFLVDLVFSTDGDEGEPSQTSSHEAREAIRSILGFASKVCCVENTVISDLLCVSTQVSNKVRIKILFTQVCIWSNLLTSPGGVNHAQRSTSRPLFISNYCHKTTQTN